PTPRPSDLQSALARNVAGQINRKSIGVVKPEHHLARYLLAGQFSNGFFKKPHALVQGFTKALFLARQHVNNLLLRSCQLRPGAAHDVDKRRHHAAEKWPVAAKLVAVANGSPDNAAQHIAASFVGWQHAVNNEKRTSADVVGDHLE